MISINPKILAGFDNTLKMRQVPFLLRPDYRKWLRYFLDFQAKYPQPSERSAQVRLFSDKLRSKGQTEPQVTQAADAVSLFFTSQQKEMAVRSSIRPVTAPQAVIQDVPEQPSMPGCADSPGRKVSGMVCEPPEPPVPEGHSWRRKGRYDDWRCLRKTEYPAWDSIVVLLADEIKARHYSRKTLQHYANWTRKFQSFLSHKDPAQLSSQDVKSYLTY